MLDLNFGHVLGVALLMSGVLPGCTRTIRVEGEEQTATYGTPTGPPT